MQVFNHTYSSKQELEFFLQNTFLVTSSKILVQLFCGTDNKVLVQEVLDQLNRAIPQAKIIGASTAGEIVDGKMLEESIVISCSVFKHTCIETLHVSDTNYQSGQFIASKLINKETKALICFSESLHSDPEAFVHGIASVSSSVVLAGGNAADNNHFESTYVIFGGQIHESGSVAAALSGTQLHVANSYSLNWLPIGREFVVTKAVDNKLYEINHRPILEICKKYLGEDAVRELPASIIEFPLIKVVEKTLIARSIVAVCEDGAFQYAGNFAEGDRVRFSVGSIDAVLDGAIKFQKDIAEQPVEAIYLYSCTVRKLFLKDQLSVEFQALSKLAPTCGFLTYGEYYHTNTTNQILNVTTTALILSETDQIAPFHEAEEISVPVSTTKTLTHLVNATQQELEKNINFLDQYKIAVDESAIVSKTDLKGIIIYVNDYFCEVAEYQREELLGANHNIIRHEDMPKEAFKDMWETISSGSIWRGIIKNKKKSGKHYYVNAMVMPILDQEGSIREYIAIRHDITKIIHQEQKIKKQTTDELTNLPNRIQLLEDIEFIKQPHLILLDIDKFSMVNDFYGIIIADKILVQASLRLSKLIACGSGTLYRIANDVFGVLHKGRTCDLSHVTVEALQQIFNQEFLIDNHKIHLSCTCGIAKGEKSLFRCADIALHAAKKKQFPFVIFNENLLNSEQYKQNFLWLKKLREAFLQDKIEPFYQPIIDNKSGEIKKYEALVRMIQEDGTPASPFYFLDIAKKGKLYSNLTKIMAKKTFALLPHIPFDISLNISVEDILNEQTIAFILEMMEKSGAADRVVLEITENEGFDSFEEVLSLASKVKNLGGKIAIDDFGTGYSNFSYLLKLQPDYIKVDGSIIKNIDTDASARAIVETIVDFSKKLNIKTIAEFVHSEAVLQTVKEIGVDFSQGYLIGKPQPSDEIFSLPL